MALPPERFANAVMVWVHQLFQKQEGGEQKWQQFVTWVDTPPLRAVGSPTALPRDRDAQEAAAFAAFQGAAGGG